MLSLRGALQGEVFKQFIDLGTRRVQITPGDPDAKGVKVGDVRLVNPWMGCGECKVCLRGDENLCLKSRNLGVFANGGYSTHLLAPHPRLCFCRIEPNLDGILESLWLFLLY
ncbi:hypothetical protein B4Q13_21570 [Lacticaseibacillus rhamnosus]